MMRRVTLVVLALVVLVPLGLTLAAVQRVPLVAEQAPPDAAAAAQTRDVARSLMQLIDSEGAAGSWSVREDGINAVLASGQRLVPGVYGRAQVETEALVVEVSAGAPLVPGGLWLNLRLVAGPSEDGFRLTEARLGRLSLPPRVVLAAARLGLDLMLGDGLGTAALEAVRAVRLAPHEATVVLKSDPEGRIALFQKLRDRALEGGASAAVRDQVYVQLWYLDQAARAAELPRQGTAMPYLAQVLEVAAREAAKTPERPDEETLKGALYALALYCGDPRFGAPLGLKLRRDMRGKANGCAATTLGGRKDLRQHFLVSAALYAATTGGTATFGVGELKELLDSNEGGSGFSFDDMAADAAGLQFGEMLMATTREDWPALAARLTEEGALMPPVDGLPTQLSEEEFGARFGDVDSPEYAAMVAEIDRRVGALPLYQE